MRPSRTADQFEKRSSNDRRICRNLQYEAIAQRSELSDAVGLSSGLSTHSVATDGAEEPFGCSAGAKAPSAAKGNDSLKIDSRRRIVYAVCAGSEDRACGVGKIFLIPAPEKSHCR